MGGSFIEFLIDSGSPVNTITHADYTSLLEGNARLFNKKKGSERKFYAYGSEIPLKVVSTFRAKLEVNNQKPTTIADFFVVQGAKRSLLGKPTAEIVKVLQVGLHVNVVKENQLTNQSPFPKAPGIQIEFEIDRNVIPKKTAYFRVPLGVENLVDEKLETMLAQDVIERVTQPSKWISPLVVVPKGTKDVRICVDMRNPNKAIKRIHHPLPIIEDFLPNLTGAKIFSRLDIKSAYHHLELHPNSRELTTFLTRKGLMRYKRLAFGVNCAPEIFQKFMEEILFGAEGCMVMLDDIIIFARNIKEHDARLQEVKRRLKNNNLAINESKSKYCVQELDFLGFHLSQSGCRPTQEKVEAIRNFRQPESSAEICSFLGLVNFVGGFIMNLSDKTKALREAAKGPFVWNENQQHEFDELRTALVRETIEKAYFRRNAPTFLYTDASAAGLGAVLLQKHNENGKITPRVIAFASKALTDVEKRYAQTQREALAVVWAVERFYIYLFGTVFKILTDHQPLKFIYGEKTRPIGKRMITRAEGWALRLQPYHFEIEYCPGNQNIADVLSRLMRCKDEPFEENSPQHLAAVTSWNREGKAVSPEDIRDATKDDNEIQEVLQALETNQWKSELIKFRAFANELHCHEGILMRNERAVIPRNLREKVMQVAHRGHPGAVTMKALIRDRVWWPGMDKEVEIFIKTCLGCAAVSRCNPPEELIRTSLPTTYAPQQNGEVERQNSGITRALRIAKVLNQPWKKALK